MLLAANALEPNQSKAIETEITPLPPLQNTPIAILTPVQIDPNQGEGIDLGATFNQEVVDMIVEKASSVVMPGGPPVLATPGR